MLTVAEADADAPILVGDDDDDEDDEESATKHDLSLSVVHVLSQMSDFKSEKCQLEKGIEAAGGFCIWLPKFHACCNAIEYVWGNRKKVRAARAAAAQPLASAITFRAALSSSVAAAHTPLE